RQIAERKTPRGNVGAIERKLFDKLIVRIGDEQIPLASNPDATGCPMLYRHARRFLPDLQNAAARIHSREVRRFKISNINIVVVRIYGDACGMIQSASVTERERAECFAFWGKNLNLRPSKIHNKDRLPGINGNIPVVLISRHIKGQQWMSQGIELLDLRWSAVVRDVDIADPI